jgi:hypothetical protein
VLLRTIVAHLLYDLAAGTYFLSTGLGWTFVRAKVAAIAGVPALLRKRAAVQRTRRADADAIWRMLDPGWLGVKMREKRFDQDVAGAD